MKNLKNYQKSPTKKEAHVSSVSITEKHRAFLKEKRINLSLLVRDVIDELMRGDEKINK